jgi:hypothetical protein
MLLKTLPKDRKTIPLKTNEKKFNMEVGNMAPTGCFSRLFKKIFG